MMNKLANFINERENHCVCVANLHVITTDVVVGIEYSIVIPFKKHTPGFENDGKHSYKIMNDDDIECFETHKDLYSILGQSPDGALYQFK